MRKEKRRVLLSLFYLSVGLVYAGCKMSNPLSGIGRALQNMFENIARSITIGF